MGKLDVITAGIKEAKTKGMINQYVQQLEQWGVDLGRTKKQRITSLAIEFGVMSEEGFSKKYKFSWLLKNHLDTAKELGLHFAELWLGVSREEQNLKVRFARRAVKKAERIAEVRSTPKTRQSMGKTVRTRRVSGDRTKEVAREKVYFETLKQEPSAMELIAGREIGEKSTKKKKHVNILIDSQEQHLMKARDLQLEEATDKWNKELAKDVENE